jgi:ribosomal protein S14
MAYFRLFRNDELKRYIFTVSQPRFKLIKFIKESIIINDINLFIQYNINIKNEGYTGIKNKCLLSGKFNSIYIPFKMSRMIFNNLALTSSIRGLIKASW